MDGLCDDPTVEDEEPERPTKSRTLGEGTEVLVEPMGRDAEGLKVGR
jgi:hypothetical protein